MSTTRRSYLIVIFASIVISTILILTYYFFRPQPLSIYEISSTPINNTITSHTTLTGRITKDSAPNIDGNYYLQTSNQLILLQSNQNLLDYLATTATITGELTYQLQANPDDIPIFTIESISNQDSP